MCSSYHGVANERPEPYWPKRPGAAKAYWILRYLLELAVRCLYRVKLEGAENLPKSGAAILAANHLSAFDPVFVAIAIRRRITALANARYFDSKHGWFFRGMGQIPLVPGDDGSKGVAFTSAHEVLEHGGLLGIFPEGNRSRDGLLHKGHLGVATLAKASGVSVVPIGIIGSFEAFPKGKKLPLFFRRITIRVGKPLSYPSGEEENDRNFTDSVMVAIKVLSGQEYVYSYSERTKN